MNLLLKHERKKNTHISNALRHIHKNILSFALSRDDESMGNVFLHEDETKQTAKKKRRKRREDEVFFF